MLNAGITDRLELEPKSLAPDEASTLSIIDPTLPFMHIWNIDLGPVSCELHVLGQVVSFISQTLQEGGALPKTFDSAVHFERFI